VTGPLLFAIQDLEKGERQAFLEVFATSELTGPNLEFGIVVNKFRSLVQSTLRKTSGIEKTRYLALVHIKRAVTQLETVLQNSECKYFKGLVSLAIEVINRKK